MTNFCQDRRHTNWLSESIETVLKARRHLLGTSYRTSGFTSNLCITGKFASCPPDHPGRHSGSPGWFIGRIWWPGDRICAALMWGHRSGSTLARVMACCLTAPSHYLNQCWLFINLFVSFTWQQFYIKNTQISIDKMSLKIILLERLPHLPWANEIKIFFHPHFIFSCRARGRVLCWRLWWGVTSYPGVQG